MEVEFHFYEENDLILPIFSAILFQLIYVLISRRIHKKLKILYKLKEQIDGGEDRIECIQHLFLYVNKFTTNLTIHYSQMEIKRKKILLYWWGATGLRYILLDVFRMFAQNAWIHGTTWLQYIGITYIPMHGDDKSPAEISNIALLLFFVFLFAVLQLNWHIIHIHFEYFSGNEFEWREIVVKCEPCVPIVRCTCMIIYYCLSDI